MSELNTTSDQLLGRALPLQIGSYVVERLLSGNPSYADYHAYHRTLGNVVLFRHERWPSPHRTRDIMDLPTQLDALQGLRRSRRLQAELQHPRIVPVIDFFQHEDEWFSIFASIPDAQSLHEIFTAIQQDERPPYSLAEFVSLSAAVTDSLAAIHRAGFVHRTLGMHNIILDNGGYVRLADMGCATPVGVDDAAARAFRRFMRSASAAPEQFEIEGVFSPATDNWALGVTLFELRYGRHPYLREMASTFEEVRRSASGGELSFPSVTGETSETAEQLLQPWFRRLLDRIPEQRYADALEAQRDLHAIAAAIDGRRPIGRAFVAMPFANTHEALWRAIWSACAMCRVSANRVDQSYLHDSIWEEICDAIRSSDFIIAVATPTSVGVPNSNVMLEIGYARALHKPVLVLTDAADTLPFDLRTQRAFVYTSASVGGGTFHRELGSLVAGVVARCLADNTAGSD
jgi:serine/threonine protein kinase